MRNAEKNRETKETRITLALNLDGSGAADVQTGVGFFDHMLTAFAVHSGLDLTVRCAGDLNVDGHHTVEDVGIVLGQAFAEAVGEKKGIARYGFFAIPMDESLGLAAIDISGRPYLVFDADFRADAVGDLETQLVREFFYAFATNAGVTLHILAPYGENDHHKCEAIFKAWAHAVKAAVALTGPSDAVLSSKGALA
ncbi:MAG: imidazoleglycerol-phosphate dehydratase HisB [Clostridiales Family XIII bacterium]|jgi:imidazoleglycerol-phosphate dehydratase|nr:imidazoleglycerol-phosphate dehydratase HisB [Clostridiales Family XIII bacterium]